MKRIFIKKRCRKGGKFIIEKEDSHHIFNVLRMKEGDEIEVSDIDGNIWSSKIIHTGKKRKICIEILEKKISSSEEVSIPKIHLVQALLKGEKTEFVIQKAVELGVYAIYLLLAKRSIFKWKKREIIEKKLKRWKKISEEASKQCGRRIIPEIYLLKGVEDGVQNFLNIKEKIFLWEGEKENGIFKYLKKFNTPPSDIVLFAGCEGSWSDDEIEFLKNNFVISVHLGKLILRAETASISALAITRFYFDSSLSCPFKNS